MEWREVDSGSLPPTSIMSKDEALLHSLHPNAPPIIHFYEWEGASATYGYFIDPDKFLRREGVEKRSIQLARRPTGGGILFHLYDFAFSILIPASHPNYSLNTLDNYRFINELVARAITPLTEGVNFYQDKEGPSSKSCASFCMAHPTQYDIMIGGRKMGGAAQRRTKQGFLHQGSLSLVAPDVDFLADVLLQEREVIEAMQRYSFSLVDAPISEQHLRSLRSEVKALLRTSIFD